jgi:hypothetical protein
MRQILSFRTHTPMLDVVGNWPIINSWSLVMDLILPGLVKACAVVVETQLE